VGLILALCILGFWLSLSPTSALDSPAIRLPAYPIARQWIPQLRNWNQEVPESSRLLDRGSGRDIQRGSTHSISTPSSHLQRTTPAWPGESRAALRIMSGSASCGNGTAECTGSSSAGTGLTGWPIGCGASTFSKNPTATRIGTHSSSSAMLGPACGRNSKTSCAFTAEPRPLQRGVGNSRYSSSPQAAQRYRAPDRRAVAAHLFRPTQKRDQKGQLPASKAASHRQHAPEPIGADRCHEGRGSAKILASH